MNDRELIKNLEVLKRYVESCAASCGDKVHGHIETITVCQEMVIKRPNEVNGPDALEICQCDKPDVMYSVCQCGRAII